MYCINFSEPNGKKVACGVWRLNTNDTYEEALLITEIINHPNYDASTFRNDIAVVKVSGTFNCEQRKIYPACIPNEEVSFFLSCNESSLIFLRNTHMWIGQIQLLLVGVQHHLAVKFLTLSSMLKLLLCLIHYAMEYNLTMVQLILKQ